MGQWPLGPVKWLALALVGALALGATAFALPRAFSTPPRAPTPARNAPVPAPTVGVVIAPALAQQGGKARITARGFAPNEPVLIQAARPTGDLNGPPSEPTDAGAMVRLTQARADARGAVVADGVDLPEELTSGAHALALVGQTSGRRAVVKLYLRAKAPWMTLGSYSVKPGGKIGLIFGGFPANDQVQLVVEPAAKTATGSAQDPTKLSPATSLAKVSTDRVGNAAWIDLDLPWLRPGTYSLVARRGATASADVVVVSLSPVVELSPWSGPPGAAVNLNARGFAANERVQVYLDQATRPTLTVTADQYGNFWGAGPLRIPYAVAEGTLAIRSVGQASGAEATSPFRVRSVKPWLELTSWSGPPGTPVGFGGGGWAASERVTIHEGSASGPVVAEGETDEAGWLRSSASASASGDATPGGPATASVTFVAVGDRSHAEASARFSVVNPFAGLPPDLPPNQPPPLPPSGS